MSRQEPDGPPPRPGEPFRIGEWLVQPENGTIEGPGGSAHLAPQPIDLLVLLAARSGRVVTKEEIFESLWHGVAVEEIALPRCISELRKALHDDARKPTYIETIPKRGYRLIAPVAALRPEADRPARSRLRRVRQVAVAGVALLAAWGVYQIAPGRHEPPMAGTDPHAELLPEGPDTRTTVAVLGFANLSDDDRHEWLATALVEMLTTELLLNSELRVVPSRTVARMKAELGIGDGNHLDGSEIRRVRASLGTQFLVYGSFVTLAGREGTELRIDLSVRDGETGETVTGIVERGRLADLLDLAAAAGLRLRQGLGGPAQGEGRTAALQLPADPEALRLYFEGLRRLRRLDTDEARKLLERSVAIDPDQPLVQLALSQALSDLGYFRRAVKAAERARDLAGGFPREERLLVEANFLAASQKWTEAVEIYRALRVFVPESLEYGLALAETQIEAEQATAALATIEGLRTSAGDEGADPRLDLLEAIAALHLGEPEHALEAAARAHEAGGSIGSETLAARARAISARSLYKLGRTTEAERSIRDARREFAAVGDPRSSAGALLSLAEWKESAGSFDESKRLFEEALSAFREIGDRAGEAEARHNLAAIIWGRGDTQTAERMFLEAIDSFRELGSLRGEAATLRSLAVSLAGSGKIDAALPLFERILAIQEERGIEEQVAVAAMNLGKVRTLQGDLQGASAMLVRARDLFRQLKLNGNLALAEFNLGHNELQLGNPASAQTAFAGAVALFRQLGNPRMLAASLDGLGRVQMMTGESAEARTTFEEALAVCRELGVPDRLARSQYRLSQLALEQGRVDEAVAIARQAVVTAGEEVSSSKVFALAYLAEALLEQGRIEEAGEEIERAQGLLEPDEIINGLWLRTVRARVEAGAGDLEGAAEELRSIVGIADELEAWTLKSEATLHLAQLELAGGREAKARALAERLALDAGARGWTAMARKAAALVGNADSRSG